MTAVDLPLLRSDRLLFRIASEADVPEVTRFLARSMPYVKRIFPEPDKEFLTEAYQREYTERDRRDAQQGTRFRFWGFLQGEATPVVMLHIREVVYGAEQRAELGYIVDHDHIGKGFATEATEAGVKFLFETLRLHRAEATYMVSNVASGRVLAKAGFEIEGVMRGLIKVNGVWEDHVLTSRINPNPVP